MDHLKSAKKILCAQNLTCVLCGDSGTYTSDRRGAAPLLEWLDSGIDVRGFSAADRVVGKATAFLYCLLGIRAVYARVMSKPALQVLTEAGIEASWDTLVEGIQNRTKTGPCPLEHATRSVTDANEALCAIRSALASLRKAGT